MSKRVWFAALAALIASLGVTGPVLAQGVAPAVLPMQGFLTDGDGTPIDGDISLRINLYDSEVATTDIFTETQTVMVDQGHFVAYIGDTASLDLALFRDNSDVWVGLAIDGGTELPRFQLGSVPYAGFAQYAGAAGNALQLAGTDAADYALAANTQARVTGSCPAGEAISAINLDGTVMCRPVGSSISGACSVGQAVVGITASGTLNCAPMGDITGVSGTGGITGGGAAGDVVLSADTSFLQRRVTGTCGSGTAISAISATGTVTCAPVASAGASARAGGIALSTTNTNLATVTVNYPAAGRAIVVSEAEFRGTTIDQYIACDLTRASGAIVQTWDWDGGDTDGWYDLTQTNHALDTISGAGSETYTLRCRTNTGTSNTFYGRLFVMYFPGAL